jgi:hypothetical protein
VLFIVFEGEELDGFDVEFAISTLEDLIVGLFHAIIITGGD